MHLKNDISNSYIMIDLNDEKCKILECISKEKDLRVVIDHKLKFASYIATQLNKIIK